jgi:hypothetical protein
MRSHTQLCTGDKAGSSVRLQGLLALPTVGASAIGFIVPPQFEIDYTSGLASGSVVCKSISSLRRTARVIEIRDRMEMNWRSRRDRDAANCSEGGSTLSSWQDRSQRSTDFSKVLFLLQFWKFSISVFSVFDLSICRFVDLSTFANFDCRV